MKTSKWIKNDTLDNSSAVLYKVIRKDPSDEMISRQALRTETGRAEALQRMCACSVRNSRGLRGCAQYCQKQGGTSAFIIYSV